MLEELIAEGRELECTVKSGTVGKYMDGVAFEKWAAKGVTYLEQEQPDLSVTLRVAESYKQLHQNVTYSFYKLLLGSLESFA